MIIEKILENPKINKNLLTLPTITIEEFELMRFKDGIFCPLCQSKSISKNGSFNGKKTFDFLTNTIFSYSNLLLNKWFQIIHYVILGFSFRKIEELVM